jgi:hypothetical protein
MGQASGVLATISSSTNLVLTNASPKKHYITGTAAQAVTLPVIAGLEIGVEYTFFNRSTGLLTITDSASANPMTIASNLTGRITLVALTGNGVWILG